MQAATIYDPKQDPQYTKPYIDIDEWREDGSISYQYIHGGFEGTEVKFSFYFPQKESYKGRFFHFMSPIQGSEDASQLRKGEEDKIAFAITNGAYFVESNMGGPSSNGVAIYQNSAAVAEFSREVAVRLYGNHRPYGYIYGGSGGGFKTMSCFENTKAWDGAVPYVIGSPMAIPCNFTVNIHAHRILRHKIEQIADAVEPGGSGDIYAELNAEERAALEEVTKMGFPIRAWAAERNANEANLGAFPLFIPVVESIDPTYFNDFWNVPGYLGAEPNSSAMRDRIQHKTVITEANLISEHIHAVDDQKTGVDDAWQRLKGIDISVFQPWMRLETIPEGDDLYWTGTNIVFLSGDAAGMKVPLDRIEGDKAFVAEGLGLQGLVNILEKVKAGDEVMLDNSNFIALQTYHRHQVPSDDFKAWDQFRDGEGKPIYPQRPMLLGPMITAGGAGSIQSGDINGKMIVVAALLDGAFPWQPDWYRSKVKEQLGEGEKDSFRLWYVDNATHMDDAVTSDELHFVSYLGVLHQALLDVSDWVERGIPPKQSTGYEVIDGQVIVPATGEERMGIQPIVTLKANGSESAVVHVGEAVTFTAEVNIPEGTGSLTKVEWSFEGETDFPVKSDINSIKVNGSKAMLEAEHTYSSHGTYFPVIRIHVQRDGDGTNIFTQVKNISRARVAVQ